MRVIICGGRWFNDAAVIHNYIDYLVERYGEDLVFVTGGATGADTIAHEYAKQTYLFPDERNIVFEADWENCGPECPPVHQKVNRRGSQYCPTAGHRRNQEMLDSGAQGVAAFINKPLEKSTGTNHMVTIANEANVPTRVIFAKEIKPEASNASQEAA